jgi:hypothetical protein
MNTLSLLLPLPRRVDLRFAVGILLVGAFCSHTVSAQQQPTASNSTSPLNIQYTGRLFGYYRLEPDIDLNGPLDAYAALLEEKRTGQTLLVKSDLLTRPGAFLRHKLKTSPDLLLGMGDNFGPEFGASIEQEFPKEHPCHLDAPEWKAEQWDTYAPESIYKSESRKPNLADCDNVTRFLMTAGYRAVVPGREDFLYTGTWLRRIAYLLRGASAAGETGLVRPAGLAAVSADGRWSVGSVPGMDGSCGGNPCAIASNDHKLHMLSANLRVTVAPVKQEKPGDSKNKSCPLLFATDLGASVECGQSDSSISASMDWLTRVDGALNPEIHASLEKQSQNSPLFADQLTRNQISILQTIVKQASAQASTRSDAECQVLKADLNFIFKFSPPDATTAKSSSHTKAPPEEQACPSDLGLLNSDLAMLVSATKDTFKFFDKSRGSASPVFNETALRSAQRLLLEAIFNEQQDAGFTIATIPGGRRVLIIGVVGKETMQEVAPDFFRVYPDTFDCLLVHSTPVQASPTQSPASHTAQNSACELKQKLFKTDNPSGSAQENTYFRQTTTLESKNDPFPITVGDPLVAAEAVLRAVWAHEGRENRVIDRAILMAQMPSSEAAEVGSQLRYDLGAALSPTFGSSDLSLRPRIDLVLSEAQEEHISGNQVAEINPLRSTVVLSPPLAFESISKPEWYPPSIATISALNPVIPHGIQIRNFLGFIEELSGTPAQNAAAIVHQRVATSMAEIGEDVGTGNDASLNQPALVTAATLLESMLASTLPKDGITPPRLLDLTSPWAKCTSTNSVTTANCQSQVLSNYLLHILQIHYKTSAAMLKRRDFWFGKLASGYDGYESCDRWAATKDPRAIAYCRLRVALDRVLWRGDYAVRVLVDGTTLTSVLKSSSQATAIETTRLANDLHQEWLSTFGLVSAPPTNLVAAASGPQSFSLPGVSGCTVAAAPPLGKNTSAPPSTPYCADGFTIATDAAYWITTSAQLAKDQSTYKDIQTVTKAGTSGTHLEVETEKSPTGPKATFLTTAIAEEIMPVTPARSVRPAPLNWPIKQKNNAVQDDLARIEAASQKRTLMQLDVSKFAAGYSFTAPSLNDTDLGSDLSGVSNTQATIPHSSELDLEATTRTITAPLFGQALVFGIQNDLEFDHKRTGNTTGKPATVTYQLNSETVGGFVQIHIPQIFGKDPDPSLSIGGPRDLPRFYWVIAPYQYQRQIVGSPLYLGYLTPPYTQNPSKQLTITVPVSDGFVWKSGLRYEAGGFSHAWAPDSGSYAELGPEYVTQSHILYGISMPDLSNLPSPVTTHCTNPCLVTAGTSITSTVQAYYKDNNQTLNASSHLEPLTRTVHAGGLYWTAHVQKVLNKAKTYSISFDTAGDGYLLPGYTLPTQTRCAISNKLAFNMNFLGNLSFSPTYSVFNFENQGLSSQRVSVNTTSFEVMLKWYYGRDTQSPPFRLLWFTGPKSGDQTTSTKMK